MNDRTLGMTDIHVPVYTGDEQCVLQVWNNGVGGGRPHGLVWSPLLCLDSLLCGQPQRCGPHVPTGRDRHWGLPEAQDLI